MSVSLIAVLMLAAQPGSQPPLEEPVAVEAEVQAEVQAPAVEVQAAAQAEVPAPVEVAEAPAAPEEEVVCRRRLRASERVGQRFRVTQDCRPRSEWESLSRRARR